MFQDVLRGGSGRQRTRGWPEPRRARPAAVLGVVRTDARGPRSGRPGRRCSDGPRGRTSKWSEAESCLAGKRCLASRTAAFGDFRAGGSGRERRAPRRRARAQHGGAWTFWRACHLRLRGELEQPHQAVGAHLKPTGRGPSHLFRRLQSDPDTGSANSRH